jgi:hypothetical protein
MMWPFEVDGNTFLWCVYIYRFLWYIFHSAYPHVTVTSSQWWR